MVTRKTCLQVVIVLGLIFAATSAWVQEAGSLRLPSVISDHMVLQAGQPAPIWGWAKPGETVTVQFAGQTHTGQAGPDGRWQVVLAPLSVSRQPGELVVAASETKVVSDVLVGEVWLGSGQSNMDKPLGEKSGQLPTFNAAEESRAPSFRKSASSRWGAPAPRPRPGTSRASGSRRRPPRSMR